MSNTSTSANLLKSTPLPSITGLPASAPMSPSPSTAVPLLMTATRFPLAVYLYAIGRIGRDLTARLGNTGGVGQRQITLGRAGFRRYDLDLSPPSQAVIVKSILFSDHGHGWDSFSCMQQNEIWPNYGQRLCHRHGRSIANRNNLWLSRLSLLLTFNKGRSTIPISTKARES